jgi:hypothetical protein
MARKWRYFRHQDCDRVISQNGCQTLSGDFGDAGYLILCKGVHSLVAFLGRKARKFYDLAEFGLLRNGTRTASKAFGCGVGRSQNLGRKGRVEVVE